MGKHFDAMCRFIAKQTHRSVTRFDKSLRYASLVEFTESKCAEFFSDDSLDIFRMPWRCVAIEDPLSCVMLERAGYTNAIIDDPFPPRSDEGRIVDSIRNPYTDSRLTTRDTGLRVGDVFDFVIAFVGKDRDVPCIICGRFAYCGRQAGTMSDGSYSDRGLHIKAVYDAAPMHPDGRASGACAQITTEHLLTALWQCVVMTRPSNWILRHDVKPTHKEPKKIPRSHQRPHWIVITDAERARTFRDSSDRAVVTDEKRHVTAHPRRAHYRKIGTNDDGTSKLTWVRSCWVGSIEAEIRGSRYRVELEI